jgi:WD40 repeat protein
VARIVCQVLHRADRITFLWSEGAASFEPYHLEGTERANLLDLAGHIHAKFAESDGAELAQLGHQLFRAVFRQDASEQGSAGAVQTWLARLVSSNAIERLEFLSDAPGLIPWNVLLEEIPASGDAGQRFWGARFSLGAGRRVNALRQNPAQVKPTQRFAADFDLTQQLSASQHSLLAELREAGRLLHTITSVEDELKNRVPDVLSLLVRFELGSLRLGADSFSIDDLQRWIEEPKEGNPDPLMILMASGDAAEQSAWQALLGSASATFSGLVANETLLSPAKAAEIGHALGQRFVKGEQSLGEILRALRSEQGTAALAFSAFCPPQVRVVSEGASDAPEAENQIEIAPLPGSPYRPFAAFAATERALFFGRENDMLRGALVTDQAEAVGVLLHGSPAVGKTSYLQAGLLPYLEQESVGYQVLRDRSPLETPVAERDYPILILRCTDDLAGQFADALSVFCAQPFVYTTPTQTQVTVDLPKLLQQTVTGIAGTSSTAIRASATVASSAAMPGETADDQETLAEGVSARELWIALRDNDELLARILDVITRSLPFELVIAVDQGEELVTLVQTPQQQARRQKALDMLMRLSRGAARCKILYTIRSQALGEFVSLLPEDRAPADWRAFYLRPLTEAEMVDALLWPTNRDNIPYCEEIPYEKYGFALEDGMATQIVADAIEASASEQQSPLAILQAVGALLYDNQVLEKKQEVLRVGDVKDLGGVKEALGKYLDQTLERLPVTKQSRQALRTLIGKLYTGHADGTLSRDLIPASKLQTHWDAAAEPVETIVNQAAESQGLFEVQQLMIGGQQDVFVSLPQDSLAQLGRKLAGQREQQAYARTRVIDVLWIMVPLIFLAAAVTFWATRHYLGGAVDRNEMRKEILGEIGEKLEDVIKANHENTVRTARRQLYYGEIATADQALRAGLAGRAREILASQENYFSRNPDNKLGDVRGFEWNHLWRRLNSERHLLAGHKGSVNSVTVAHDGKRAASAGADGFVRIWNLQTGKIIASIPGAKTLYAVAFAPDDKSIAAAGDDKIVRVWDISELKDDAGLFTKEPKKLEGHGEAVHAIAFGKNAAELASAGADKLVIIWDIVAGKPKYTFKEHAAAVKALVYTSDGKTLVSAGDEAWVFIWDPNAGKKRDSKQTSYRTVAALAVSPDGKTLCTAGAETKFDADVGAIRFWELDGFKEAPFPILGGPGFPAVAFGPDGKTIASGGKDNMVRLWELKAGKELHQWIGHVGFVNAIAYAKDGSALVSASFDGAVKVWDPNQSSGIDVIMAHADAIGALVLNRDDTLLASGAHDGSVKLWDPKTNKLVKDLASHKGAVTSLAFSRHTGGKSKDKDEFFLAVGTRDANNGGEIKIWQIQGDPRQGWTAKDHLTLKEQTNGVTCLAFHPSEDKADVMISGSADKTVKVWDAKSGKLQESHAGHKDEVRCVAFSFDATTFASGGKDSLVCMYELGSKEIRTLADMHLASIDSIALFELVIKKEGGRESYTGIVTGSADQTVRIWGYRRDAAGEKNRFPYETFRAHTHHVSAVAYSKGTNSEFFSASWDGSVKVFDHDHERLTLTGHQGAVRAIAVAADQSFLASAGNDGTIRIWRTTMERGAGKREIR